MAPRSFLSLPWELRHMIYKYYFTTKEGYHSSPTSHKLTEAHGEPIDLALMYTCRFVGEETKGMPFLYNDITFKTFYRQDLSPWLCRFDRLVEAQFLHQIRLLVQLCPFITLEMRLRIKERFPWFVTNLSSALTYHNNLGLDWRDPWRYPWGSPPDSPSLPAVVHPRDNGMYIDICPNNRAHSAHRAAIEFTLRLLCETLDEQFIASVDATLVGWEHSGGARLSNFLDTCYEPWRFPSSLPDLDEMGCRLGDSRRWSSINSWVTSRCQGLQCRPLYRFSAASAAIGFLDALPTNRRSSLRNIIIHEDRVSAGYSDGHAIGLIPFCQENRRLRITHKFSMVRNLFERAYLSEFEVFDNIQEPEDAEGDVTAEVMFTLAGLNLYTMVENCLAEAMYLPDAGMPNGSYTLLLDGEDAKDMCSAFFQQAVLGKDARRLVLNCALKAEPNSAWAQDYSDEIKLVLNAHGDALEHLSNKTSFFQSNFCPGHMNNIEALIAHYKGVGMERCIEELVFGETEYDHDFRSFSHVPRWGSMVMESFEWRKLPEYQPITHRRSLVKSPI